MNFDENKLFTEINTIPPFYQEVILSFHKSRCTKPPNSFNDILCSLMWGNKYFTFGKKRKHTLYFKNLINLGIIFFKDIMITHGAVNKRYIYSKLNHINIFQFLQQISKLLESI